VAWLYTSYLDPTASSSPHRDRPSITVYQDVNGNPISFFDGQEYRSLQATYIAAGEARSSLHPTTAVDLDDLVGELAYRGEEVGFGLEGLPAGCP